MNFDSLKNQIEQRFGGKFFVSSRSIVQGVDQELRSELKSIPTFQSQQREKEWAEGRRCLREIRNQLDKDSINNLKTSITHSKDWVVAAGLAHSEIVQIGVDLERLDRKVSEGKIARRVIHPDEARHGGYDGLSLIEFWVIKEACLKACPDSKEQHHVTWNYVLTDWNPGEGTGRATYIKDPHHAYQYQVFLYRQEGWVFAVAVSQRRVQLVE